MPDVPGTVNFPASLDSAVSLIQAGNNATTQLVSNMSNSDTTITVASNASFPATGSLSIDGEVIFYGATYIGTKFLYCVRGQDGTTAASHNAGTSVQGLIVAAHHNTLSSAIVAAETKLGSGSSTPTDGKTMRGTGAGTSEWTDKITVLSDGKVGMGTTSPNSALQVAGPIATAVSTKTAAYTIGTGDSVILGNAASGAFSVTLPTAVGITGRRYTIKKIDSSANAVTIATTSSQTIDGAATVAMSTQWARNTVVSDGANWLLV